MVLFPYTLDMNRGISCFASFHDDRDGSGVEAAVVDMALGKNGLLCAVELPGPSKLSSSGMILLNVSKTSQYMNTQTHGLEEQISGTLTNV